MDGLKLDKWKENFKAGMANVQIEFDALFLPRKLDEFYIVKLDEVSQNLELEILHKEELPSGLSDRIIETFTNARPEDSI